MKTKTKPKPAEDESPSLIPLADIANKRIKATTTTIRRWVAKGVWPEPHSVIERTWFFRRDVIEHYIQTGEWPDGTKFKRGEGRGRGEA